MSVVLDALRRARGQAPSRPSTAAPQPAGIPAGLGMGRPATARVPKKAAGETRWGLVVGVIVAAAAVWAGVNFGLPLLQQRMAAPRVVATTGPRPGAPAAVPAPDAGAPASDAAAPAPPVPGETPGTPSMTEMLDKIGAAPAVAPRAMPGVREPLDGAVETPTSPAVRPAPAPRTAAARPAPPRPPVRAAPAPALTTAAVVAVPTPPAVNHFDLAVRYQSLGNFEQALAHYSAVLQTQEFNVEARNNLGLLYLDRGLVTEAIDQFKRAILINPEYVRARGNLAVALMNAGRLDEARAELRAAIAIAPRNVDLLVNMALVEKAARQPEQAKLTLLRALGIQPTHAAAHYNLAVLYDEAGESAQAYDEYNDFLTNAGPEHGARLSDVRRRVDAIAPKLDTVR